MLKKNISFFLGMGIFVLITSILTGPFDEFFFVPANVFHACPAKGVGHRLLRKYAIEQM